MSFGSRLVYGFLYRLQSEGKEPDIDDLTSKFPVTDGEAAVILADWHVRQQLPYLDDTAELDDL